MRLNSCMLESAMKHFFQKWTDSVNLITEQNINFPLHLHQAVEIVLVAEGDIAVEVAGENHVLCKNDVAVIFPGQLHSYHTCTDNSTLRIIIFNPIILKDFFKELEHYRPEIPFLRSTEADADIYLAFDRLYRKDLDNHPAEKLAWIQLIMAMILPKLKMIKNTDMGEYDLIYRIIDYLSSHYTEHITLDDLAKELHVNKYYLSHTFSSKLNSSFPDYLNRLRCDHAQMLLSSTNEHIATVGELSGFETQRTFNRVFKLHTGMTPNEYRAAKQP